MGFAITPWRLKVKKLQTKFIFLGLLLSVIALQLGCKKDNDSDSSGDSLGLVINESLSFLQLGCKKDNDSDSSGDAWVW